MSAGLQLQRALLGMTGFYGFASKSYAETANNYLTASTEMSERFTKEYVKPDFNITHTDIGGKKVDVTEEVVIDNAFASLLHFKRDTKRNDPKLLIVAPMSGHFATLLRDTVKQMLPSHDVYITDWKDAREVPLSKGDFGLDDYISYVKEFITKIGTDTHVVAVCQPTVPTMAAVSRLAQEKSDCQPLSMTLMGGPVDTSAAPSDVTKLARTKPLSWFEENLIGKVPSTYAGAGRLVYPGFVQLFSFIAMHPDKHTDAHVEMFESLVKGDREKADKRKAFYDEYLAVCDLPAKFYLETVENVFIDQKLAKGTLTHEGEAVDPGAIRRTALFTIEGENDDISTPGQTTVAHRLCSGLAATQKYHHLQPGTGHYGIFNGRSWREEIAPRVTGFIRSTAAKAGVHYDEPNKAVVPPRFEEPAPDTPTTDDKSGFGKKRNKLAA
ncbi:MAG: polyhydroxyalkanoate depolymerase [Micavibrio sp.]|nr:polyhydroxyalkanoate depolymerase [Micavibrio sp.]